MHTCTLTHVSVRVFDPSQGRMDPKPLLSEDDRDKHVRLLLQRGGTRISSRHAMFGDQSDFTTQVPNRPRLFPTNVRHQDQEVRRVPNVLSSSRREPRGAWRGPLHRPYQCRA